MLSQRLKSDTKFLHDLLEKTLKSNSIFEDQFTQRDLKNILQVLLRFHLKYENEIFSNLNPRDFPDVSERSRINFLVKDLQFIAPEENCNQPQNQKIAVTNGEALGWFYVIEGSSLGGNVIMKRLSRNENFSGFPFHYYSAFTDGIGQYWKNFLQKIDNQSELNYPEILSGAEKAYNELITIAKTQTIGN